MVLGQVIKERFPRLFYLSNNREGKVRDMGCWEEGSWEWKIEWRRELLERENGGEVELFFRVTREILNQGGKKR